MESPHLSRHSHPGILPGFILSPLCPSVRRIHQPPTLFSVALPPLRSHLPLPKTPHLLKTLCQMRKLLFHPTSRSSTTKPGAMVRRTGWFIEVWEYTRANDGYDLGGKYEHLLASWVEVMKACNIGTTNEAFTSNTGSDNVHPNQIDHWIKCGRKKSGPPAAMHRSMARMAFGRSIHC